MNCSRNSRMITATDKANLYLAFESAMHYPIQFTAQSQSVLVYNVPTKQRSCTPSYQECQFAIHVGQSQGSCRDHLQYIYIHYVPGDPGLSHIPPEDVDLESLTARRQYHLIPGLQGGKQRAHDAVHVKKGHHQVRLVGLREFMGLRDVLHRRHQVPVQGVAPLLASRLCRRYAGKALYPSVHRASCCQQAAGTPRRYHHGAVLPRGRHPKNPDAKLCGVGLDQRVAPTGERGGTRLPDCAMTCSNSDYEEPGGRGCGCDPEPHGRQEGYDELDLIHEAPPPESRHSIARSPHP